MPELIQVLQTLTVLAPLYAHALAKTVLFLTSGDVSLRYQIRDAALLSGLLAAVIG